MQKIVGEIKCCPTNLTTNFSTGDALLFYRISSSLLKGDGQLKISD